jgi:hypothetical protein
MSNGSSSSTTPSPPADPAQPTVTAAATDFRLLGGRPSWEAGSTIRYSVSRAGCLNDCIGGRLRCRRRLRHLAGLGAHVHARVDRRPRSVRRLELGDLATIDGIGGTLAFTAVCRALGPSKQIVGFQTSSTPAIAGRTLETAAGSTSRPLPRTRKGTASASITSMPRGDARLTMYPFITPGDVGFPTLGCGDRLGVNALYGTSLTCAGVPLD